jgi:uncharacterized protein (TIGR00369 family)
MTEREWLPLARVDRHCFGCGFENLHGLQMQFLTNGEQVRSSLTMEPRFRGWSNLIHGGVLATILDEMMGWTVLVLTSRFMLTRGMQVAYRKPVRVGAKLSVTGYIKEQNRGKRAVAVAEIRDEVGELCATSEGVFALFSYEQFKKMQILPDEDLEAMWAVIS